jgi:phosphoglycerate dehydrogenase-like enzyme
MLETRSAKAVKGTGPIHMHVDNVSALGPVFQVTWERVAEALARRPGLGDKVRVTIGTDGRGFEKEIRTANVLFGWHFDRSNLALRAPNLRWIHIHGAGVGHMMPLDWLPRGAVLTNSRGVHGPKADEYTAMALLMLNNGLPRMVTNQRASRWEQFFNTGISGKTVLILGVGHVGGGAARWARRFGLYVIGIRRSGKSHRSVDEMHTPDALRSLLPRADFVLVTAPHTKNTHHIIGARELELMKPGAGLVNYSRANLVDYTALAETLKTGKIMAILDVFEQEPLPSDSLLWHTPNLIITPHCSSDDREAYTPRTLDLVFRNMERFIAGNTLVNRVRAELQY